MTVSRDPDRLIHAFIGEGEDELQDQVYDAVRAAIDQKRQRAVIGPWRTPTMNKIVTIGLGAAAVVLALVVGIQLFGSSTGGLGGPAAEPTPTHEPTTTPQPSVAEPTNSTDAFLPEGPQLVVDSTDAGAPSITMAISGSGWAYWPEHSALLKGDDLDNLPEAAVISGSYPSGTGFFVPEDPCRYESTQPEAPATTADEMVAALAAQESRDASEPMDVTLDGYAGKMITVHVPADADFTDCEGGEFMSFTNEAGERWQWHQGPGQIDDFWFVDVDGALVEIRASYRPDTPAELVTEMRTIVESATFEFPDPES